MKYVPEHVKKPIDTCGDKLAEHYHQPCSCNHFIKSFIVFQSFIWSYSLLQSSVLSDEVVFCLKGEQESQLEESEYWTMILHQVDANTDELT